MGEQKKVFQHPRLKTTPTEHKNLADNYFDRRTRSTETSQNEYGVLPYLTQCSPLCIRLHSLAKHVKQVPNGNVKMHELVS